MIVVKTKKYLLLNNASRRFCQNKLPKFNTSEVGKIAHEHG